MTSGAAEPWTPTRISALVLWVRPSFLSHYAGPGHAGPHAGHRGTGMELPLALPSGAHSLVSGLDSYLEVESKMSPS